MLWLGTVLVWTSVHVLCLLEQLCASVLCKGEEWGPPENLETNGGEGEANADSAMIWASEMSSPSLQRITERGWSVRDQTHSLMVAVAFA